MLNPKNICICILFYGATPTHAELANKVLNPQMAALASSGCFFIFGCNAVGADTCRTITAARRGAYKNSIVVSSDDNIYKYPMMRKMLDSMPENIEMCIWFDHDSHLLTPDVDRWLTRLQGQLISNDVLGSVHKMPLSETECEIAEKLWGEDVTMPAYVTSLNPSWWAASSVSEFRHHWPPAELGQKYGHVLFGEFIRRRNLRLAHFRDDVAVNVNGSGVERTAPQDFLS